MSGLEQYKTGAGNYRPELHKKYLDDTQTRQATETLALLREKSRLKSNLFVESDTISYEKFLEMNPGTVEILETVDAFNELSPSEREQILFSYNNLGRKRPENPIIHNMEHVGEEDSGDDTVQDGEGAASKAQMKIFS
jgi:hypothetical protein